MNIPINKRLYERIKKRIKARVKVWPSAYASGQLVREYKRRGGKYRKVNKKRSHFGKKRSRSSSHSGSLSRWFKEQWVDVCRPKGKSFAKCGRKTSKKGKYPYCRPLRRVNRKTPRTVREIGRKTLAKMCKIKRKNPYRRYFLQSK
jgi:hypothetical protein